MNKITSIKDSKCSCARVDTSMKLQKKRQRKELYIY